MPIDPKRVDRGVKANDDKLTGKVYLEQDSVNKYSTLGNEVRIQNEMITNWGSKYDDTTGIQTNKGKRNSLAGAENARDAMRASALNKKKKGMK